MVKKESILEYFVSIENLEARTELPQTHTPVINIWLQCDTIVTISESLLIQEQAGIKIAGEKYQ